MTSEFKRGMQSALPTGLGYLGVGMAFGVIAAAAGITVWQVLLMSLLIYAGAGQFALVGLLVTGEPLSSIALTIFLINLRNFLMALHTATFFPDVSAGRSLAIGGLLTDETYGLLLTEGLQKKAVSSDWMLGNNILSYCSWIAATVLGAVVGERIPDPQVLGLDFALMAMFIGIFAAQFRGLALSVPVKKIAGILLTVASVFFVLACFLPKSAAVLSATLAGCVMGVWLDEN